MAKRAVAKKRPLEPAKNVVREISAGGIVDRIRDGIAEVALIRVRDRWCLPKGQVEKGEAVTDTAAREVREETGLHAKIETKLDDISYWFTLKEKGKEPKRVFKRVYFYLLSYLEGDVGGHDAEVDEAAWFPGAAAVEKLAYPSEKKVLSKALALLDQRVGM